MNNETKQYKILKPIAHSGKIYKVGEVVTLSTTNENYFNFWHRRMQDGEIEEVQPKETKEETKQKQPTK